MYQDTNGSLGVQSWRGKARQLIADPLSGEGVGCSDKAGRTHCTVKQLGVLILRVVLLLTRDLRTSRGIPSDLKPFSFRNTTLQRLTMSN